MRDTKVVTLAIYEEFAENLSVGSTHRFPRKHGCAALWLRFVASLCGFALWLRFVASLCGFALWLRFVASLCGFALWLRFVASLCGFALWLRFVASLCGFALWLRFVSGHGFQPCRQVAADQGFSPRRRAGTQRLKPQIQLGFGTAESRALIRVLAPSSTYESCRPPPLLCRAPNANGRVNRRAPGCRGLR